MVFRNLNSCLTFYHEVIKLLVLESGPEKENYSLNLKRFSNYTVDICKSLHLAKGVVVLSCCSLGLFRRSLS